MSLAYTEEGVTEWLQPMLASLVKFFSGRSWASGDSQVMQTFGAVCRLMGSFLDPVSYWAQLRDALDGSSMEVEQRVAHVRILALAIQGSVEALLSVQPPDPSLGLGRLATVIPELVATMHSSDLLQAPTPSSREVLWQLLFAFLEPLRHLLASDQVSQLLFVVLALAARAPPDAGSELSETFQVADPAEGLVNSDNLQRALANLSSGAVEMDLDSMDEAPQNSDPQFVHMVLFERAFPEVLARLDGAFEVFRSVLHVTPLPVLSKHREELLRHLAAFARDSSVPTRCAAQALGVHLAMRCSRNQEEGSFAWSIFQVLAQALLDGQASPSFAVITTSLSLWRRFALSPDLTPKTLLFPPEDSSSSEPSLPMHWLTLLLTDQELYKRYHAGLEHAESVISGRDKENFVVAKARELRIESERRSNVTRAMAASILLLGLRRTLEHGEIPWLPGQDHGSAARLFLELSTLLRTAKPTMDPPFVRPMPPALKLYAAELLHLLLHLPSSQEQLYSVPPALRLLDDAACAIHQLPRSVTPAQLPQKLQASIEEQEAITADCIQSLIDLNLTLPPDPNAKHAPATLDGASGDIVLGDMTATDSSSGVPSEVSRLISQSEDCLRWNAAYALYILGVDLTDACLDGFQQNLAKWKKRREQAKVVITEDLLQRATRALGLALAGAAASR